MHFPVHSKKNPDIFVSKEVRRSVWSVQHANFPCITVLWDQWLRQHMVSVGVRRDDMQYITGKQGAACVPTELSECEGGFAAQIIRHLKTALDCQIGAATKVHKFADLQ